MYRPPISLRPAAIFWSLPYFLGQGWLSYRLLPLLSFSAIASFLLLEGLRRQSKSSILTVPLICAGPAIYGLIIFRPETFILAFVCGTLYIFRQLNQHTSAIFLTAWSLLLVFGFSTVAYIHPKALYLTPFLIVEFLSLIYLWRHRSHGIALWLICIAITSTIALQATAMHQTQLLHCTEYPSIEAKMNSQSINLYKASRSLKNLQQAFDSLTTPELRKNAFDQLGFKNPPDVGYLPNLPPSILVDSADLASKITLSSIILLGFLKISTTFPRFHGLRAIKLFSFMALCLALTIPYILSLTKHWYDAAGFCGGITFISVVFLNPHSPRNVRRIIASLSVLTATLSIAVILSIHDPAFMTGYSGPGVPIHTNRSAVDKVVKQLISKYHIKANAPLVVDDLTYEAAKDRPIVIPITYLSLGLQNIDSFRSTLDKVGLEYGIASTPMPHSFWDRAGFKILETIKIPGDDKTISLFAVKEPTN